MYHSSVPFGGGGLQWPVNLDLKYRFGGEKIDDCMWTYLFVFKKSNIQ